MKYIIYKTTNLVNNKIYIGKHKSTDINDDYLGSGKLLKRAIEKYGKEHFKKEILFECKTEQEANDLEAEIVDEEFITRLDTYNIMIGGHGGFNFVNKNLTKEQLHNRAVNGRKVVSEKYSKEEKIKWAKKGAQTQIENKTGIFSPDFIRGCSFKGKHHTEEAKEKMRKANSINQKGKNNSGYGTCWIYILKLKQNKKIKKEDLNPYLNKDWIKGELKNVWQVVDIPKHPMNYSLTWSLLSLEYWLRNYIIK